METPWRIFEETQPIKLYAKNQMIYLQEETAIRFYYLKKGRVKIFLSSPDGLEKTLAVLQPGSLFGEASFFDGKPRVSSAKTLEKSEILSINRPLRQHVREFPEELLEPAQRPDTVRHPLRQGGHVGQPGSCLLYTSRCV